MQVCLFTKWWAVIGEKGVSKKLLTLSKLLALTLVISRFDQLCWSWCWGLASHKLGRTLTSAATPAEVKVRMFGSTLALPETNIPLGILVSGSTYHVADDVESLSRCFIVFLLLTSINTVVTPFSPKNALVSVYWAVVESNSGVITTCWTSCEIPR